MLDKSPVADTAVVNARGIRLDVGRLMALIALCFALVVKGRECAVLLFGKNSDYTTGGEPRCDLVWTNEGLKRLYVCVVLRLHSPRMCAWSTLCVLRVVLFTIFSRDLVSHILLSRTLHLGLHRSTRDWLLKTCNFLPSTTSRFLLGFVFSLSLWLADGRLATWTTKQQTVLLSIQEWFDPRSRFETRCLPACVCVCVFDCVEVFYEQPPTAPVIWDVLLQGSCSFVGHILCNLKSPKWNIMPKMEAHRYFKAKTYEKMWLKYFETLNQIKNKSKSQT